MTAAPPLLLQRQVLEEEAPGPASPTPGSASPAQPMSCEAVGSRCIVFSLVLEDEGPVAARYGVQQLCCILCCECYILCRLVTRERGGKLKLT